MAEQPVLQEGQDLQREVAVHPAEVVVHLGDPVDKQLVLRRVFGQHRVGNAPHPMFFLGKLAGGTVQQLVDHHLDTGRGGVGLQGIVDLVQLADQLLVMDIEMTDAGHEAIVPL